MEAGVLDQLSNLSAFQIRPYFIKLLILFSLDHISEQLKVRAMISLCVRTTP
jgi:hypothetical protein